MTKDGGSLDTDLIRELATLLDETSLTEIEIEIEGRRFRVARNVNVDCDYRRCSARTCRQWITRNLSGGRRRRTPASIRASVYLADGRHRLSFSRARGGAVYRNRQHRHLGPDASHHRSDEDDEPHPLASSPARSRQFLSRMVSRSNTANPSS